jgi:hypothetical protein
MSLFAEASTGLTPQDWQFALRGIIIISGACVVAIPILTVWKKLFGKYATLEALRARTDPLEQRIRALETYRAECEKEMLDKLKKRSEEYEREHRRKH